MPLILLENSWKFCIVAAVLGPTEKPRKAARAAQDVGLSPADLDHDLVREDLHAA